jgi:hypothetical protein
MAVTDFKPLFPNSSEVNLHSLTWTQGRPCIPATQSYYNSRFSLHITWGI